MRNDVQYIISTLSIMKTIKLGKEKCIRKNFSLDQDNKPIEQDYKSQVDMINQIYLGINIENYKKVISELKKKISSYKLQDERKERYNADTLIKEEELYEKLVVSKLKCYYCNNAVKIEYGYSRDDFQWTLDRIDNSLGHSSDNTVISCLKCNLQRRVIDCNKFNFTKKLKIQKK